MNRKHRALLLGDGLLVGWATTAEPSLACQYEPLSVAETAASADRIVLGTVISREGEGAWTYVIDVEREIKGSGLPDPWTIEGAGASDCGMSRLDAGQHVVLEYFVPGRMYDGPWFYAWKIEPDGTIAVAEPHQPIEPMTLTQLQREYARLGLPDTSTAGASDDTGGALLVGLFVAAATVAAWSILRRLRDSDGP